VEQCYWLGNVAPFSPPVLIDALTDGQQASMLSSATFGAFTYSGNLYKVVAGQQTSITLVCKSVNVGATWTRLDAASAPAFQRSAAYFDGVQTVIVAFQTGNSGAVANPINFQDFDLATETWGVVYGAAGAPSTFNPRTIWKRPDGTYVLLYSNRNTFNPGDPSGLAFAIYDPGTSTWTTTDSDAGANIILLAGWDPTQTIVQTAFIRSYMDAAGNVGVFFRTSSVQIVPVIWGNRCFYQQILANDTLGSFFDFPGQVAPLTGGQQDLQAFSGSPLGQPVIVGDIIVLPTLQRNRNQAFPAQIAVAYLGTPVATPVWSTDNTKLMDPDSLIDTLITPQESPSASSDGTTIFAAFPAQAADGTNFARIRLCQTVNLASPADGWSAITAFDFQAEPPPFDHADQSLTSPSVFAAGSPLAASCNTPPSGAVGAPYSHSFTAVGGTAPYTFSITAGSLPNGMAMSAAGVVTGTPYLPGSWTFTVQATDALAVTDTVICSITVSAPLNLTSGGSPFGPCRPRNEWDWCALAEQFLYRRIKFPPLCSIPKEYCNLLPWDEDFGANAVPPQAVPLHRVRGIVTPVPAAGDQTILEMRMPLGYDGLLAGIFHFYTGNGFSQGSGDIVWRVQVNLRYIEDLGNLLFQLGSPQSPMPLTEGQILLSGQTLRYIVNVPNLSGLIQVGQSQITAGLVGFLWPR
jgi:hypothetical protein